MQRNFGLVFAINCLCLFLFASLVFFAIDSKYSSILADIFKRRFRHPNAGELIKLYIESFFDVKIFFAFSCNCVNILPKEWKHKKCKKY